jgi:hypothetical protein
MKKITEEELEGITKNQTELRKALNDVGVLEAQKHGLLHEIATINSEIEKHKSELEEKYGSISINLETGEYTEIEKEEEEKTEQ